MTFPSIQEIQTYTTASWDVVLGKTEAMQRFDLSAQGFWRSFYALFIAILLGEVGSLVVSLLADDGSFFEIGAFFTEWTNEPALLAFSYAFVLIFPALHWVTFAFVIGRFANRLGIQETYSSYIIVRNWAWIFLACFGLLVEMMIRLSGSAYQELVLSYLWMFFEYWVYFRVARLVAVASIPVSLGLVALEYIVGIVVVLIPSLLINLIVVLVF
ncbi:hypothetical protein PsAD13_01151 [Pseudovibrio sp. Ad13]|uniref:hypothetical protein n=1 Tax=Pseudovibrio sp. Ad13 TaxID=989396 RepID=UPI0007AEC041|nr:hypothetical protein [Pseudovibrio sp. Ad13]KZK86020.1 hypothetical protein PsAD13_01151 [Pseudovibrio sp. Ad13]